MAVSGFHTFPRRLSNIYLLARPIFIIYCPNCIL